MYRKEEAIMSSLNFQTLRDYPSDINNANLNMEEIVNNIYVGPQGELLETIDRFNRTYGTDLGITKHFTLKPGCYDKIKKAYSNWVLRWDMRPRGVSSIFNRIRDYGWRFNGFRDNCLNIERKMANLRLNGMHWQDNTEDCVIEFNRVKSNINNALEICKKLYPNVTVDVKIIPCKRPGVGSRYHASSYRETFPNVLDDRIDNPTEYMLALFVYIKDPIMTVHALREDETISQYEIPIEDISVASGGYLLPMLSRNWGRDDARTDTNDIGRSRFFLEAIYLSKMGINQHPYIAQSSDKYTWDLDQYTEGNFNICTGNMGIDIKSTFINCQFEAHIAQLVTWLTNYYVPQTNPLNNIRRLRQKGESNLLKSFSVNGAAYIFDEAADWHECTLPESIYGAIHNYGRRRQNIRSYSSDRYLYREHSQFNEDRKLAYINNIEEDDLPCIDCIHKNNCKITVNIHLFLSREIYTPMEEAYLGIFIEIGMYYRIIGSPTSRTIHFLEDYLPYAFYYNEHELYDRILKINTCILAWTNSYSEDIILMSWSSERYKSRMRILAGITSIQLDILYIHAVNKTDFVWTRDNVTSVQSVRRPSLEPEIPDEDEAIRDWLEATDPPTDTNLEIVEDVASDNLTPEQATLRWATTMGGANNL